MDTKGLFSRLLDLLDWDVGGWIRSSGEIFGPRVGRDIDVKEKVLSEVDRICKEYERFERFPFERLVLFILPNDSSERGSFELSLVGGQELKQEAEKKLTQQFPPSEIPSVEVVLCDADQEVPPPVKRELGVDTLADTEERYYVHTTRQNVITARLHCDFGPAHQDTVDIQGEDRVNIGRGREVSPDGRQRRNDFAFLNPQNPEGEEEEERLSQATKHEKAALRVIHRDHAEIEQEGHQYHISPGHSSYRVRIERSRSRLVVTSEGKALEDGDRILLMPDEERTQLQRCASIDVELETEQVEGIE